MDRLTYRDENGKATRVPMSHAFQVLEKLARYEDAEEQGRLIVLPCKKESDYAGLKVKYVVVKADTGELVENCFVLRPDKDPAARLALEAYAQATDNQVLASDIASWIGGSGKVIVLPCEVDATCKHALGGIYLNSIGEACLYCEIWDEQRNITLGDCLGNCESEEAEAALGGDGDG